MPYFTEPRTASDAAPGTSRLSIRISSIVYSIHSGCLLSLSDTRHTPPFHKTARPLDKTLFVHLTHAPGRDTHRVAVVAKMQKRTHALYMCKCQPLQSPYSSRNPQCSLLFLFIRAFGPGFRKLAVVRAVSSAPPSSCALPSRGSARRRRPRPPRPSPCLRAQSSSGTPCRSAPRWYARK